MFYLGAEKVSEATLPALNYATVIALIIIFLLPLSVFKTTRFISTWGFLIASFIFGIDVWMYGFLVTLHFWGVGGVFVGLCLVGIGVVPLGMIAAALHSSWDVVVGLAFGIAMTYGTRMLSFYLAHTLAHTLDRAEAKESAINSAMEKITYPNSESLQPIDETAEPDTIDNEIVKPVEAEVSENITAGDLIDGTVSDEGPSARAENAWIGRTSYTASDLRAWRDHEQLISVT